jgi:hypothetical protein
LYLSWSKDETSPSTTTSKVTTGTYTLPGLAGGRFAVVTGGVVAVGGEGGCVVGGGWDGGCGEGGGWDGGCGEGGG